MGAGLGFSLESDAIPAFDRLMEVSAIGRCHGNGTEVIDYHDLSPCAVFSGSGVRNRLLYLYGMKETREPVQKVGMASQNIG